MHVGAVNNRLTRKNSTGGWIAHNCHFATCAVNQRARGRRRKTINVEGVFSLNGNPIELETDHLTMIGDEVFILIKKYGKVKVTYDCNARVTLWLKLPRRHSKHCVESTANNISSGGAWRKR